MSAKEYIFCNNQHKAHLWGSSMNWIYIIDEHLFNVFKTLINKLANHTYLPFCKLFVAYMIHAYILYLAYLKQTNRSTWRIVETPAKAKYYLFYVFSQLYIRYNLKKKPVFTLIVWNQYITKNQNNIGIISTIFI